MLMPFRDRTLTVAQEKWLFRSLAGFVVLLSAGLHLLFFLNDCPYNLAQDEAHYWDWSRNLDWSYYSKGPLVAWLIRGSCVLTGSLSESLIGSQMLSIRLPAVLCGSLLLVSIYALVVQVYGSDRFAFVCLLFSFTIPVVVAGSSLMTIDSPYTCCWGWALVLGYRAIFSGSSWSWPLLGMAIGLGILAKYTMILLVPSLGLFLLTSREHRGLLWKPGFWIMCLLGALCCLPILIWNIQNGWVSLKHVGTQAGVSHRAQGIRWDGPLHFLGGQCALLMVYWFFVWLCAMVAHRPWRESDAGLRYLWWLSAPMFLIFLGFSLKNGGGQINWAVTAYISGLVLAAGWLAGQLRTPKLWYRRWIVVNVAVVSTVGLALTILMHKPFWLREIVKPFSGEPTAERPLPLRRFDPTCRLRGWSFLAEKVQSLRKELEKEGNEVILATSRWNVAGEIGFYAEGQPTVYCIGSAIGDRHSQYDLWHPNPMSEPEHFRGKTFLLVGGLPRYAYAAFEQVEKPRKVTYYEDGDPICIWYITICRGFRQFPPVPKQDRY